MLGVKSSRKVQGTRIGLFGAMFFSQNGILNTYKYKQKLLKMTAFWDLFRLYSVWLEHSAANHSNDYVNFKGILDENFQLILMHLYSRQIFLWFFIEFSTQKLGAIIENAHLEKISTHCAY